eukprot:3263351-Pyramimonas_sp.AAC.1
MRRRRRRLSVSLRFTSDVAIHLPFKFPLHRLLQGLAFTAGRPPLEDNCLKIFNRAKQLFPGTSTPRINVTLVTWRS